MKQTTPAVVLALFWILIITIAATSDEGKLGFVAFPINENMYLSNEVHGSIHIWNNSHFIQQAEAENWDGNGSESTPYLIDAYNITSDNIGIQIQDITLYFVIRDCYLDSVTGIFSPGIFLSNVSHGKICGTTVTGKTVGIDIDFQSQVNIERCKVFGCTNAAINVYQSDNCRIDNCELYGGNHGIQTRYTDFLTISNTEVHASSDIGIYITESYFVNVTGGSTYDNGGAGIAFSGTHNSTISFHEAYNNSEGRTGVHLLYSDNATIINNKFHDNIYAGLLLRYSHYAHIQGNLMWNNSDSGLYLLSSNNCSIAGNDLWSNGFWSFSYPQSGIVIDDSLYTIVQENGIWNNSLAGIILTNKANLTEIKCNSIYNNTFHGIYADDAHDVDVIGNNIFGNGWQVFPLCGINTRVCSNWLIEANKIWNNTMDGIRISYSVSGVTLILNNEIFDNTFNGITIVGEIGTSDYVVDNNIVHNNHQNGIDISINNQANITNNIVYDNSIGILIQHSAPSWIYGNDIGWNSLLNAADISGRNNNNWHNSVSIGNCWSDYSGSGDYIITALAEPGAYDIFPKKSIDLIAALPISYEITEVGNTMFWNAYAMNPSHYEVYTNDILLYSEAWDGGNIETNLDGLTAGDNEITVVAYHISGHSTNEKAIAEVIDLTPPVWTTTPTDQEITEGDSFNYQLSAEDPSGIGGFAVNNTVFQIDSTGRIFTEIILLAGEYSLNVTVWDTFGNTRSAIITVTVLAVPFWRDATIMLLVAAGGGTVILIVVVVTFLKKRK